MARKDNGRSEMWREERREKRKEEGEEGEKEAAMDKRRAT